MVSLKIWMKTTWYERPLRVQEKKFEHFRSKKVKIKRRRAAAAAKERRADAGVADWRIGGGHLI